MINIYGPLHKTDAKVVDHWLDQCGCTTYDPPVDGSIGPSYLGKRCGVVQRGTNCQY